jgi:peptide-methionine (R)-S-oxide reductase
MNKKHLSILAVTLAFAGMAAAIGCSTSASPRTENNVVAAATPKPVKEAGKEAASADPAAAAATANDDVYDGSKVVKTKAEWKALLTPAQFHILREEGTEAPYSGKLTDEHADGTFYCAACHLKLFSSKTKFDSGTGWPSFYQPINKKNVVEITDRSLGMERTEVECARCRGHLGHVFDDGPKPTGLRYCMNSDAMTFEASK